MIRNEGEEEYNFKKCEAIVQGLFMKYLNTQSDKSINIQRKSDY